MLMGEFMADSERINLCREHCEAARGAAKVATGAHGECELAAERGEISIATAWSNVAMMAATAAVAHAEAAVQAASSSPDAARAVEWSRVASEQAIRASQLVML